MNSSIALAGREWNGTLIHQRITDGYVNATAMCQANNARLNNYLRNARTCAYINALAAETGILATCLVQLTRGGRPDLQGTWVHPRLSIDLARWISPAFAVFMDGWFLDWIQGGRQAQPAPAPAPVQLPAAQRDSYSPGATPPPLPQPRGVVVYAPTEEAAAKLWCRTLQAAASLAIWAQFKQSPPPGSRLAEVDGYTWVQSA